METIVSVSVLAAIAVGSLTLISKSMQSVSVSQNRLIASYLAQEGIELVRNVRDSNWDDSNYPASVNWDDGLPDCADCEMDYTMNVLADATIENGDPYLKLDSDNFYFYPLSSCGSCVDTIFKRHITVDSISAEQKKVTSEVVWEYQGRDYNLVLETFLYNWQ